MASRSQSLWKQFRRLLLGTVVEAMLEEGVALRFDSLRFEFDDDSVFKVPRLDNYMRFKGHLRARLDAPLSPVQLATLKRRLEGVWPELLGVLDLGVGDRLTSDRNAVRLDLVDVDDDGLGTLDLSFDLEAD